MREAGVLQLSALDLLKAKEPYQTHDVKRHTTWIYEKDKPIYELIDPKGNVFVMQSYSIQKSPQTESSLRALGKKLNLPSGWHFKTGVLKQSETLEAIHNVAVVVQDDLLNTYQKASVDFLR